MANKESDHEPSVRHKPYLETFIVSSSRSSSEHFDLQFRHAYVDSIHLVPVRYNYVLYIYAIVAQQIKGHAIVVVSKILVATKLSTFLRKMNCYTIIKVHTGMEAWKVY